MDVNLKYQPGERVWLIACLPDSDDHYIKSVRGNRCMTNLLGTQVTIANFYNDGPGRIGYLIKECYGRWFRPDLFDDMFENDGVIMDADAFEALMS